MGQRSRAICDLNHPVNLFIMIEIAKLGITLDNDQLLSPDDHTDHMATAESRDLTQFMSPGIVRIPE